MKRKICVITGSRAEYGLLKPLIDLLKNDKDIQLQLVVTGMHLSPEFGNTYKNIENDDVKIDEKIEVLMSSDTPIGICKSIGLGLISFSEALSKLKPDTIVVLGDRFEIFSAVTAAHVLNIPTAHIHGGEVTEGAIDDAFRHSITKMSYLHFTSTEEYRKRVIQLGENPERVFNVGAIGLDNINNIKLLSKKDFEKSINFELNKKNLLITFHPVTLENNTSELYLKELFKAFNTLKNTNFIFTKANADTDGRIINKLIDEYVEKNKGKAISYTSLGQLRYLSAMQYVDAVVGNSSSGIIEAPSFKICTINIGDRQKGRVKSDSVFDCKPDYKDIINNINKVYLPETKILLTNLKNPYQKLDVSKNIVKIIKENLICNKKISFKEFYDVDFNYK